MRRPGERLERSITSRAKNVTLEKGDRRDGGKHVSLNPLPVPPVDPRISSSWKQTAATDATLGRQHEHARAHAPPRVARGILLPDFPAQSTSPPGPAHGFRWPRSDTTPPTALQHTHSDSTLHPQGAGNHLREALAVPVEMTTFPAA